MKLNLKYTYLLASVLLLPNLFSNQVKAQDLIALPSHNPESIIHFDLVSNSGSDESSLEKFIHVDGIMGGGIRFDATNGSILEVEKSVKLAYIPDKINGVKVTEIGSSAFEGCKDLTEVTLPEDVISIGSAAFRNTGLKKIFIPKSVTRVYSNTFSNCKDLKFVFYGGSSLNIGLLTAEYDYRRVALTENYIPPSNVTPIPLVTPSKVRVITNTHLVDMDGVEGGKIIYGNATTFYANRRMVVLVDRMEIFDVQNTVTSVKLPEFINDRPVIQILTPAFEDAENLTTVSFPNTLEHIDVDIFKGAKALKTIDIPVMPCRLSKNFMLGAENLDKVYFNSDEYIWDDFGIQMPNNTAKLIAGELSPEWHSFSDIEGGQIKFDEKSGTVEASTEFIGFNVDIPKEIDNTEVKIIGNSAFRERINMRSVTIPNSVERIKADAFRESGLESVTLPSSLKYVSETAFVDCDRMHTVYYAGTKAQWDELNVQLENEDEVRIFYSTEGPVWLNVEGIEGGRIKFDSVLGKITDADKSITFANIPEKINGVPVKIIGTGAFEGIPFAEQTAMGVLLPNTITSLEENAFRYSGLTYISIPKSVENIETSQIRELSEPGLFGECFLLKDIYFEGSKKSWEDLGIFLLPTVNVHYSI
ncbi:MAG: hypothetical protein ATN31_01205 [Candidatus Epulonipiscioides saccharophilum]|nr:MAG: hypothetical protein ATN31_01205 [Epulopiscium sp. AS2M-Bin001]